MSQMSYKNACLKMHSVITAHESATAIEICRQFLARGADIEAKDNEGETAFMIAAQLGNLEICRFLLNCGANIDIQNKDGTTPLMFAMMDGNPEICAFLLEHGVNIDMRNNIGATALMHYVAMDTSISLETTLECVALLLKYGANVESLSGWMSYHSNRYEEDIYALFAAHRKSISQPLSTTVLPIKDVNKN
jgi:ankyrin repeat protein